MSDTNQQTHASRIYGTCRGVWSWGGESYTAAGILVPRDVIQQDDDLTNDGYALPPDEDVLDDLTPTLDPAVLPPNTVLAPPPIRRDKSRIAALKAAQDAARGEPAETEADPGLSDIERKQHERELADRDEIINANGRMIEELKARLDRMEAAGKSQPAPVKAAAKTVSPAETKDPIADATAGAAPAQ
jgi:hypothetical protein